MLLPEAVRAIDLPTMIPVRQIFPDEHIPVPYIPAAVRNEIMPLVKDFPSGSSVAILTGSRGIANIDIIIKALADILVQAEMDPFIIPAMGSHGGGTAEGQLEVLRSYGITETTMGIRIDPAMDTVVLGQTAGGVDVHFSKAAMQADYIIPVGRVKAHTDFSGPIESGLCKMLAIGGGKHNGCSRLHREGFGAFAELIPAAAEVILKTAPVPFGLAIIENAHENTYTLEAVAAADFLRREPELLKLSKDLMARIQFDEVDILIVQEIGKNISGTGMDPNVIGRDCFGPLPDVKPQIQRIIIEGITPESHYNALGCGMGDFILREAFETIDFSTMYTNSVASCNPNGSKIPIIVGSEDEAIRAALQTCWNIDITNPKIVKIKDTLHLTEIQVSENMLPLCADQSKFELRI
ncbi:MAG: lactate racemase domain-containing protein [Bacillota bacterium]|nr:lactate racemase domain-containing protein [Bacillota bacterium]